ncbi:hypothetical protein [Flavobacterium johnsoniae]|uniref:Uncharacterized protein n=1 Tax=Flavobacterium johnsoniae TaxID=986 RepID=A0A1M5RHQ4_FLAJO|nr:hypothetical protein [Flavobacterium johnsoniae]SHH25761.1 hypothetical protein SAMN05444388_108152 [Flavobacterium johnsoniae]
MAKYAVHKISFFFNDENLNPLPEEAKGNVVMIFNNLDEARIEKMKQDIFSVQNLSGTNVNQFYRYQDNEDEVFSKLKEVFKTEFDLVINKEDFFDFPEKISESQAKKILDSLKLEFNCIIEYDDDEDPHDFEKYEDLLEF